LATGKFQSVSGEFRLCPSDDICAYIDGELGPGEELELELHFAGCSVCADELNAQKKLLCALDSSLENEPEIDLPADFTKIVVTNAESRVSGLRRSGERSNAVFICSALFLFILLSFGIDSNAYAGTFLQGIEKAGAVLAFASHMAYDMAIGAVVILRSLGSQLVSSGGASTIVPAVLALAVLVLSRSLLVLHRS
jgi:anti-sigma factor RsiW